MAIGISLWALLAAGEAAAQMGDGPRVLFIQDPLASEPASVEALSVELASRGATTSALSWTEHHQTLRQRADAARAAAAMAHADAALWLEPEVDGTTSVRAVAPGSRYVAWAPVPAGALDARVVALVAASLLDEVLAPPAQATLTIRVPGPGTTDEAPATEPSVAPAVDAAQAPAPPSTPDALSPLESAPVAPPTTQRRRFYIETGVLTAGIANGAAFGMGGYFARGHLRVSGHVRVMHVILSESFAIAATNQLAYVTGDDDGRFEIGVDAGAVIADLTSSHERAFCELTPCGPVSAVQIGPLATGFIGFSWTTTPDTRMGLRAAGGITVLSSNPTPAGFLDLYLQILP